MFQKIKSLLTGDDKAKTADDDDDLADVPTVPEMQPAQPQDSNSCLTPADTEQALLAGELRAAQKIQMGLVPKTFPPIPGCLPFDLYAILEPAREIGGDFYDFWMNGREHLTMVIGDVSGKGIPAALFMAVCRTYLRAFSRSEREPAKLLEFLNKELSRHNDTCMFVTLLCAVVHIPTGRMEYANAGHNPPFIRRRDGTVSRLDVPENPPIGFMQDAEYVTRELVLEPGESILFYTDGMPEAFNAKNEMLGDDESLALFKSASASGGCRIAIGQLRAEVDEFTDGAEQSDDITMMMYGQLEQTGRVELLNGKDMSDSLMDETGVFSLSNLNDALPRLKKMDGDLGQSLSGL